MLTYDSGVAWFPPIAIALAIMGAAVLLAAGRLFPRFVIDIFATAVAAAVTGLATAVLVTSASGRVVTWSGGWLPHHGFSVGILLESDPVGAGVAMLAAALMTLALIYSWRYLSDVGGHYHALMLLFLAGMTGFAFTGDLFDMFVFFELMGAAAYGLTALVVEDASALEGALNFGVVNSLGAYLSLSGVALLYARTGQLGLAQLGASLDHHRPDALVVAAFVLVLTGFLVKGAVVPLHFWLADAHAVAPPPVCVIFSGVMVPLGLYAALRVYWVVFSGTLAPSDIGRAFVVLGVLTALLGAVMCVAQRHVKRLLAYSTIGHVGLFLCALGLLDREGTAGALLYVVGHAAAKSALFMLAGLLLFRFASVDEHDLYGRGTGQRVIRWLWIAGALALAGMPPFGTSLAKSISEDAALRAGDPWLPAVFVLVSGMTGGAVLRVAGRIFFAIGPRPSRGSSPNETSGDEEADTRVGRTPLSMLLPIVVLLAGCLVEGIVPGVNAAAEHAASYFTRPAGYRAGALSHRFVAAPAPRPGNWNALGVALGFASTAVATVVALGGLYSSPLRARLGAVAEAGTQALGVLRRLHSGHIGDYVAWMMTGIALLAALVGLPLLHS